MLFNYKYCIGNLRGTVGDSLYEERQTANFDRRVSFHNISIYIGGLCNKIKYEFTGSK